MLTKATVVTMPTHVSTMISYHTKDYMHHSKLNKNMTMPPKCDYVMETCERRSGAGFFNCPYREPTYSSTLNRLDIYRFMGDETSSYNDKFMRRAYSRRTAKGASLTSGLQSREHVVCSENKSEKASEKYPDARCFRQTEVVFSPNHKSAKSA